MTIDRIANSSPRSTPNPDDAPQNDHAVGVAPAHPQEKSLDADTFRTFIGHHAMLWYVPSCLGTPFSGFEPPRSLASGHSSSLGALLEVVRARMVVAELVETVNPKARFSVRERSDVVIMCAENCAARNMFRAYSGLIRARVAEVFDVATLVWAHSVV